jgi:hypothetical protein
MVSGLEKVDTLALNEVNQAMLLRDPTRPDIRAKVLQRLGLANSREWVAQNRFD